MAELPLEKTPVAVEGSGVEKALRKAAPSQEDAARAGAARLNAAALKEYERGNYRKAEALLTEAVSGSQEPVFIRNLAAVKLKLDDMEGAASLLGPLEDDPLVRPTLKGIYITLGNRASLRGDAAAAAEYYGKGARLDPDDRELKEAIKRLDKENDAERGMGVREGGRFIVKFEG
ncbi:MAG: hypothetical protein Q8P48_01590, partial [Deltaproteobacteria bacterium]|nr:hypothetical protein [Deltaproteobacteria bacterium]